MVCRIGRIGDVGQSDDITMLQISSLSTEYIKVEVTRDDGTNPTADTVKMAFVADGVTPATGDFKVADWQTIGVGAENHYYIRCLIGPAGTIALAAGLYVVWVKISDSPETPVKRLDFIKVI